MKEHIKKYFPERDPDFQGRSLFERLAIPKLLVDKQKIDCEMKVKDLFENSNELKLLVGAMKKYGCDFNLSRHVSCEDCYSCRGGYDPDTNQIIACKNQGLNKLTYFGSIVHEMIHMFDNCRANFDFDNLKHIACSEIRAANLTYCSIIDRLRFSSGIKTLFNIGKTHHYCVKNAAFASTQAYAPEKTAEEIWEIIEEVFDGCYNDTEPFGRRYIGNNNAFRQSYRERFFYGYD